MAQSNHTIKDVYNDIFTINDYFYETENGQLIDNTNSNDLIHKYCHYDNHSGNGKCNDYFQRVSSAIIHLLEMLKDKLDSKYDKLAEYAILWLSYKLNEKPKDKLTDLNKFYTQYIEKNNDYNKNINGDDNMTYKNIIDKKKYLMNIKEISKFNDPFGMLLSLYYLINNKKLNCTNYLEKANEFADQFKNLNKDSNNTKDSPFIQILSTLSNDYENIKNIYHEKKSCEFPSLSKIEPKEIPVKNSEKGSGQSLGVTFEVTSSSSSILNTIIPGLSTFAIPVFLGVAYKYSLFGIDKLFQRQYIRNKLKKTKKKMELNI
ncbi:CIR protein PIR protein [Plasmodium vinckei vinckei]|uniref:CIR protein PIR protein n=1 Tax=Plasmodium vinckei vinckei TaxID=54757 RepID=A0A449BUP7_PLAVN|nr:CIR protein PIR protein [Plasmodium vinckei vinckei]VEV57122.1 CIR protein PIR protein [Plasmodium vinckei vinckei]